MWQTFALISFRPGFHPLWHCPDQHRPRVGNFPWVCLLLFACTCVWCRGRLRHSLWCPKRSAISPIFDVSSWPSVSRVWTVIEWSKLSKDPSVTHPETAGTLAPCSVFTPVRRRHTQLTWLLCHLSVTVVTFKRKAILAKATSDPMRMIMFPTVMPNLK